MIFIQCDTVAVVSESGSANLGHASGFGTPAAWESAYNTGLWQALVEQVAHVARTQHEPSWPFSRLNFKSCLENTLLRALVQGAGVWQGLQKVCCTLSPGVLQSARSILTPGLNTARQHDGM